MGPMLIASGSTNDVINVETFDAGDDGTETLIGYSYGTFGGTGIWLLDINSFTPPTPVVSGKRRLYRMIL